MAKLNEKQRQKLKDAFADLCGVCRPRSDLDDLGREAAARRLWKFLSEDFDYAVALETLDRWPQQNQFFPTEKELRDLLAEVALDLKAAEHPVGTSGLLSGRFNKPTGATQAFYEKVREVRGKAFCKSWLRGGVTVQYSATQVFTTRIGYERLNESCKLIAEKHGVEFVQDEAISGILAQYCDDMGLEFKWRRK